MRPLTDEEMRIFFEKMQSYIGNNIAKLIDRSDEPFTFRMIKDRVFYLSEAQMKLASNIGRENLLSIGTCFGKFTKNDKFRLHISCLDYISQYAKVIIVSLYYDICTLCWSVLVFALLSHDDYTMLILIYNSGYIDANSCSEDTVIAMLLSLWLLLCCHYTVHVCL